MRYEASEEMKQEFLFSEIKQERERQDTLYGEVNKNLEPFTWITVLSEEVGEASHEALCARYDPFELQAQARRKYREELIQVAAVAVAAVECLDRQLAKEENA